MTIEVSHGKARPTLPRASVLAVVDTAGNPTEGRAVGGRFAPGNRHAEGQRWKSSIRKLLGRGATTAEAEQLARESFRLYLALLRGLPSDGPSVRTLAALQARHVVLAARWANRAAELGFDSEDGIAADERSLKHGQRAERLAVTALDVATRLPKRARRQADIPPWLVAVAPDQGAVAPAASASSRETSATQTAPASPPGAPGDA